MNWTVTRDQRFEPGLDDWKTVRIDMARKIDQFDSAFYYNIGNAPVDARRASTGTNIM